MDDLTPQTSNRPLPELVHSTLETLRNLRLGGPPTLQAKNHAKVWRSLSTAGNNLIDTIEDLRFEGHERWETGDAASVELFGRLAVPQAKEFLQNVTLELASLGTTSHVISARIGIDTQRFDPNHVPRLVEQGATTGDVKIEDVKMEDVKKEDVDVEGIKKEPMKPEAIEPKAMKTEPLEPSPQDPVFPSIGRKSKYITAPEASTELTQHTATTNSFKTPTAPRPADYKTPPRGPSFPPIIPLQSVADTNANANANAAPQHPPLQYDDPQRFRSYISSINFDSFHYDDTDSMFDFPTPTDVQKGISPPPPQLAVQPGSATATALAETEYMASVKSVAANLKALVYLMRPLPQVSSREE